MAKIGDTVRFLNATGGGVIRKIEGKMAMVEEDGFETPVLLKDLVVVLPAGHEPTHKGANIMFDQSAFDKGKQGEPAQTTLTPEAIEETVTAEQLPVTETDYGDTVNITLAFEPSDVKSLDKSRFTAVLVNDSNYYLDFTFMRRAQYERGWTVVYRNTVPPNQLIDIAVLRHEDLPDYERIAFQAIAYKQDKIFTLQTPVSINRKLDLTKFHKFHCFRPGIYFDNPVIEIPLVKNGAQERQIEVDAQKLQQSLAGDVTAKLAEKYKTEKDKHSRHADANRKESPYKLLPLIEMDLHVGELLDSTAGMEAKDILDYQLSTVRKTMAAHEKRKGQKIVFIHGKGEGVLRKAVLDLLKKEYPKAELQDASFREYGFGATLVTIH